jgi:outer membrane receptor protein involved in Fe transport
VSPVAELALRHVAPAVGIDRVYLSYAKSTQTPTYFALNSNAKAGLFRGNPSLDREIAQNIELGAQAAWGAWQATTAVFFRRDERLVDWTYSASATNARTANPVDVDTAGFEAVVRYTTPRTELVLGYTGLTKNADYGIASVDASFYALNYPKHRLTAAATVKLGGGWEIRSDNEARIQQPNALRRSDDDPLLSSIGVYFSPRFVRGLTLLAEVENLWNSNYEEVPAVPAAQRQFTAGATYAW